MEPIPLSAAVQPVRSHNAVAAGTTASNGAAIDCSDCEGVMFVAQFGTLTATAVTGIKAQQSDDNAGSDDYTDLEGSAQAIADTGSNKCLVLDVYRPRKRYVRAVVTRGTANAVIDGVIAIKYGLRKLAPSLDTTVAAKKQVSSPAEGTA